MSTEFQQLHPSRPFNNTEQRTQTYLQPLSGVLTHEAAQLHSGVSNVLHPMKKHTVQDSDMSEVLAHMQAQLNQIALHQQAQSTQLSAMRAAPTQQQQQQQQQGGAEADEDDEEELDPNANKWAAKVPLPAGLVMPPEFKKAEEEEEEAARKKGKQKKPVDPALKLRTAKVDFMRRLFAELVGMFILTWTHGTLRLKSFNGTLTNDGASMMHGLTLVLLIYALGSVSGAHFNPVVTLAFLIRRMFPVMWVVPYWLAQLVGSILGGAFIRGFHGSEAYLATNFVADDSSFTLGSAFLFEALLTFILIFTILAVAQKGSIVGLHAALAVGAAISLCIGLGAGVTGGTMNPFRTLGCAIVNGPWRRTYPIILAPILGCIAAVVLTFFLSGPQKGSKGTAMGTGKP